MQTLDNQTAAYDSVLLENIRQTLRCKFPSLQSKTTYLENAGGSQVPHQVIDRISQYLQNSYVQLGAGYLESEIATKTVSDAHNATLEWMGCERNGAVILGASSTALLSMLANCYAEQWTPGDEIVVAECGHEANIGPWLRLANAGAVIRWWKVDGTARDCTIEGLKTVLSNRTRLVVFPHVSNLLGHALDVSTLTELCHRVGAEVVVDGVAFAPHRALQVSQWNVDWYVASLYKVYGPHLAALYGKSENFNKLDGPNHFFIPRDALPDKFEPGGIAHELAAGWLGTCDYLRSMAEMLHQEEVQTPYLFAGKIMQELEEPITEKLLSYLASKESVQVIGRPLAGKDRLPTVSFLSNRCTPAEAVAACSAKRVGIRLGHMYSKRLLDALALPSDPGVIRVSAVHYNSLEEVDRLIEALDPVL